MSYSSVVLATAGLVNYWRCGDASPPLTDAVGGISLTEAGGAGATNASLITSDPANGAWKPNGGVYRSAGNFTFGSSMSLEVWTDPTAIITNNNNTVCGAWSGPGSMLYFQGGTNNLAFYTGGSSLATPAVGGVQHWVGTYDGTDRRIYINGSLVAGPTAGAAVGTPGVPFQVSGYANSNGFYWDAPIDEVAVYNVALSAADVLAHYNAGVTAGAAVGFTQAVVI